MRRSGPKRAELFQAAVDLVSTGSNGFKSTARRYSLCPADAEDAYQRGLEILITKAPTSERDELRPWLHTVIKHEALAIRRQRERMLGQGQDASFEPVTAGNGASPEDGAPERERARRTAEALTQLKPGEVQCLLLKALGYSYEEISARTGFSWTKVNRSLSEGRKRFHDRFAQIESGQRCRRFRSLLSVASDGEAAPDDERMLKTHLRACPGCRAALREYRAVPARVAELLPPAALLPALPSESWWSRVYDTIALWTADRGGAIGHKLQHVGETLSAQKATAVVASTAALTSGAVVHDRVSPDRGSHMQEKAAGPHSPGRATDAAMTPASSPVDASPPSSPERDGETAGTGAPVASEGGEFTPEPAAPEAAEPDHVAPASPAAGGEQASGGPGAPGPATGRAKRGGQPEAGQEFGP